MSQPPKQPTLAEIARQTGFARSTVSLGLRNHPSLPPETREKIHRAAAELGYRPNPLVTALMSQLRGKRLRYRETIAVVSRWNRPIRDLSERFYHLLMDAICGKAAELGLKVEEFPQPASASDGAALQRVLMARGIHGVLFFPGNRRGGAFPKLDWSRFATVLIGLDETIGFLDNVVSDYAHNIDLALRKMTECGYRRVGLAVHESRDMAINMSWTSRFLLYQRIQAAASDRVPLIAAPGCQFSKEQFLDWVRREMPEVILMAGDTPFHWLCEAGLGHVGAVNLVQRGEAGVAGVDPCSGEVGRAAVDLLFTLLQSNQIGLPAYPRNVAIKGIWVPGKSFRE